MLVEIRSRMYGKRQVGINDAVYSNVHEETVRVRKVIDAEHLEVMSMYDGTPLPGVVHVSQCHTM